MTNNTDDKQEEITLSKLSRILELTISGKKGTRTILAMLRTVEALERIEKRNYEIDDSITEPFK